MELVELIFRSLPEVFYDVAELEGAIVVYMSCLRSKLAIAELAVRIRARVTHSVTLRHDDEPESVLLSLASSVSRRRERVSGGLSDFVGADREYISIGHLYVKASVALPACARLCSPVCVNSHGFSWVSCNLVVVTCGGEEETLSLFTRFRMLNDRPQVFFHGRLSRVGVLDRGDPFDTTAGH